MFKEYEGISDDAEIAFVDLASEETARFEQRLSDVTGDQRQLYLQHMNRVLAIAAGLDLPHFNSWKLPDFDNAYEEVGDFRLAVESLITQIKIRKTRHGKVYSVSLDTKAKEKIHFYVRKIRDVLEGADLEDKKRDSLFTKLAAFELDVDRSRTPFNNAMLALIDVAAVGRKLTGVVEPLTDFVNSITELLGSAKADEPEQQQLPPTEERKRIEPPRKQIEGPKYTDDSDGDIPF